MLAEETQQITMDKLRTNENGQIVDSEGNIVDVTRFGITLENITMIPETQFDSQTYEVSSGQPETSNDVGSEFTTSQATVDDTSSVASTIPSIKFLPRVPRRKVAATADFGFRTCGDRADYFPDKLCRFTFFSSNITKI